MAQRRSHSVFDRCRCVRCGIAAHHTEDAGRANRWRHFLRFRPRGMERFYSRVADQARNQYTLYYSPDHKDRIVTYHSIEVQVKMAGLTCKPATDIIPRRSLKIFLRNCS